MLSSLDLKSVEIFLNICRKEIKKGNCQFIGYRSINKNGITISAKQALIEIGIFKIKDIWNYILELESSDCIGVDRDNDYRRDFNSEIYIFLKKINNKNVYIKLTMNNVGIVCISFHESYKK